MAFSNQIINAPVRNKPHIVKIDGYWRVSPKPRITRDLVTNTNVDNRWFKAHSYILGRNFTLSINGELFAQVARGLSRGPVTW